jgi:alanine racemase
MTHFADADAEDRSYAREQLGRFEEVRRELEERGVRPAVVHAANSAAALGLPEARLNMVRAGIALSGHYPSRALRNLAKLQPALRLSAKLARVFAVKAGESVGYGRTWVARRPSIIGLFPAGYADGYVRALSNRADVLVQGRRCPVVGRVSMDQSAVDLTELGDVVEGEEVVLLGAQGGEEIGADELARHAGTISYEILCGLTARVPKRYIRDSEVVAECDLLGCEVAQV